MLLRRKSEKSIMKTAINPDLQPNRISRQHQGAATIMVTAPLAYLSRPRKTLFHSEFSSLDEIDALRQLSCLADVTNALAGEVVD